MTVTLTHTIKLKIYKTVVRYAHPSRQLNQNQIPCKIIFSIYNQRLLVKYLNYIELESTNLVCNDFLFK